MFMKLSFILSVVLHWPPMENVQWFVLMNTYQFVVLMVKHMTMIVNDRRREFVLIILLTVVGDTRKKKLIKQYISILRK